MARGDVYTGFVFDRGGWVALVTNVDAEQAARGERCRYVPNRMAVHAPEMLEALEGLERKLFEVASRHDDRTCDEDVCPEVRAARRVRAAVEGRADNRPHIADSGR